MAVVRCGFRPAAAASWVFIRFRKTGLRLGMHATSVACGHGASVPTASDVRRFGGVRPAESRSSNRFPRWSTRIGLGASAPRTVRKAGRSLRRSERWTGDLLEASVCSFDARDFGLAPSISEAMTAKQGSTGFARLAGVTLRCRAGGARSASAPRVSGSRRPRAARRVGFTQLGVARILPVVRQGRLRSAQGAPRTAAAQSRLRSWFAAAPAVAHRVSPASAGGAGGSSFGWWRRRAARCAPGARGRGTEQAVIARGQRPQ